MRNPLIHRQRDVLYTEGPYFLGVWTLINYILKVYTCFGPWVSIKKIPKGSGDWLGEG